MPPAPRTDDSRRPPRAARDRRRGHWRDRRPRLRRSRAAGGVHPGVRGGGGCRHLDRLRPVARCARHRRFRRERVRPRRTHRRDRVDPDQGARHRPRRSGVDPGVDQGPDRGRDRRRGPRCPWPAGDRPCRLLHRHDGRRDGVADGAGGVRRRRPRIARGRRPGLRRGRPSDRAPGRWHRRGLPPRRCRRPARPRPRPGRSWPAPARGPAARGLRDGRAPARSRNRRHAVPRRPRRSR